MDLNPIFSKVVLGAAEASLDVAGAALLPGAWPILKGALTPILDRLKERLGGKEVTSSPDLARRAVAEFQADQHLQEILRSNLLERLDLLAKGQQGLNGDVQKLMLIVTGDQQLLQQLTGGVDRIEHRLDRGVNLSDDAIRRLAQAVSARAETSREVRALALSDMGPIGQLLQDQVHRLQIRADELLGEGQTDRALDEVRAGLLLVATLLHEAPTDRMLRLQLGFLYKTLAQVFDQAGDAGQSALYLGRAEEVFRLVKDDLHGDEVSALELANAIHGLGNIDQERGNFHSAIDKYKLATEILPQQFYSWHDMFLCYIELAKNGEVNLERMRQSLTMFKTMGQGQPGLGEQHVAQLEALLKPFEIGAGT